jgi:LmbE family N-acetylglucosaminyl deacetylase
LLKVSLNGGRRLSVLCLGAHSDDIEIGCGGTVLKLVDDHDVVTVHWVVLSARSERADEARASAQAFLASAASKTVVIKEFRDGFFPYTAVPIKEYFEELKSEVSPDIVFTHYRDDRHQDHRLVSDLTWNTFRDHLILEYEIPKYDGDMGNPNVFVHLDDGICRRKVENIRRSFRTQAAKQWFSEDTFLALLRLRGIESNSPTNYAEGFYGRRLVM